MVSVSLLGVPHDDNSSYLKGPAEAPPLIRRELVSDAYSMWTEAGVDLGAPGQLIDHGDILFDGMSDPWDAIEGEVGRALSSGNPLICLGPHAITRSRIRSCALCVAVTPSSPSCTLTRIATSMTLIKATAARTRRRSRASWKSGWPTG
jgi:hypothetical protein